MKLESEEISVLSRRAHNTAVKHGFYKSKPSKEHLLMLICTEISYAVQADRNGLICNRKYSTLWYACHKADDCNFVETYKEFVKDTVNDEMADIAIRLYDFIGNMGPSYHYSIPSTTFIKHGDFAADGYRLIRMIVEEDNINDILQYIYDWAFSLFLHLRLFIDIKMRYNKLRPYKNGKRY